MKTTLKTIQLLISLPLFWLSTALLILACAVNPSLYPVFVKHAKNLGKNK